MNKSSFRFWQILWCGTALMSLNACKPQAGGAAAGKLSFSDDIRPILQSNCVNCHHQGALLGNLNLENRQLAMAARPTGPVIVPGEPEKSPLFTVLNLPEGNPKAMPPSGHRLGDNETALIKRWIAEGADWPDGPEGVVRPLPPLTEGVTPQPKL